MFGPFKLDAAAAALTRDGQIVPLRPKAFALLLLLVQRRGLMVSKDEVLDVVWGRRFVSEGVIKTAISELRSALGDDPKQPHWITTVARRGYRFAALSGAAAASSPLVSAPRQAAAEGRPALGNWAAVLSPLVGRQAELGALHQHLQRHHLVTLAGASGVGKTRLSLACAHAEGNATPAVWRDGVWFIELAGVPATADSAAGTGFALVSVLAAGLHLGQPAARGVAELVQALAPLHLLLVLDNAEHLLGDLVPVLAALLQQAPGLHLLVTSQQPLHMAAEKVMRLQPLAYPIAAGAASGGALDALDATGQGLLAYGAVRLFVQRVAERLPGFVLQAQNEPVVAHICRALDGLPLALELAAARVPLLGLQGLAQVLLAEDGAARLALLNLDTPAAAPHHRSLMQALSWSHSLLSPPQQVVFRRLSVFSGGFTLAAAQEVCSSEGISANHVLEAVDALLDKSLLVLLTGFEAPTAGLGMGLDQGDVPAPPRLVLMGSLHDFAWRALEQAGEVPAVQNRHLLAVRAYWQRADRRSLSDPSLSWLARHKPEADNLRSALRLALDRAAADTAGHAQARLGRFTADSADAALELVVHAVQFWSRAGLAMEGHRACEAVRSQASATAQPHLRHGFGLAVASLAMLGHVYPSGQGLQAALQAAEGFESTGDRVRAYYGWYLALQMQFRLQATAEQRAQSIQRMTSLESPHWSELLTRYRRLSAGYELRLAGDVQAYTDYCRFELARLRRLGAVAESWGAAQGLMLAESDSGHFEAAIQVGRQALEQIRQHGRLRHYPALLALWVTLLAQHGDAAGTWRSLVEALPVTRSAGTPWMLQPALAWLALQQGRTTAAAQLLGWHQHTVASGRATAGGSTIVDALQGLQQRLLQQLGDMGLARCCAEGTVFTDAEAEALAMARTH